MPKRSGKPTLERKSERPSGLDTTLSLLGRAKAGDEEARGLLYSRYLPRLRRWASGRLPRWARQGMDTSDIVQESLVESVRRLDAFQPHHPGALQAYLYQVLRNRVYQEVRKARRRPPRSELDSGHVDPRPSPLEEAIGQEALRRYEAALESLGPEPREAIVLRLEMGLSYEEVAAALGKRSPDAARMFVSRALVRLVEEMGDGG